MPRHAPAADATGIEKVDIAVAHAAAEVRYHPVTKTLGALSEVGDQPPLFAVSAATAAAGVALGNRRLARAGARMFAAEALATLIKSVAKRAISRTRPRMMLDEGRYAMVKGGPNEGKWNSFPSGHTAGAVAVARALARDYPALRPFAYASAGAVAIVQIPRCAHYPSDIAAGAAVGWLAAALVDRAFAGIEGG